MVAVPVQSFSKNQSHPAGARGQFLPMQITWLSVSLYFGFDGFHHLSSYILLRSRFKHQIVVREHVKHDVSLRDEEA